MKTLTTKAVLSMGQLKKLRGGVIICSEISCSRTQRCCVYYVCGRGRCIPL